MSCLDSKSDALDCYDWTHVVADSDSVFRLDQQDRISTHASTTITWKGRQTGLLNRPILPSSSAVALARAVLSEHHQMETEDLILLLQHLDISENDALDAMQHLVLTGVAGIRDYSVLYRIEMEIVIEILPRRKHWIVRAFRSLIDRFHSWRPGRRTSPTQ